ncbi:hypothetical protein TSAR_004756 [Trichomalopsis sarcophagae]|uniref:Uncharacterized protein n=1 Tax=Trichomalopsis sarcophagae TaxID=543379 RepID=A0A232FK59_9HYME|nr:hypothetical protein TSAR_004756 [Trichomalopsis sarcophagae]
MAYKILSCNLPGVCQVTLMPKIKFWVLNIKFVSIANKIPFEVQTQHITLKGDPIQTVTGDNSLGTALIEKMVETKVVGYQEESLMVTLYLTLNLIIAGMERAESFAFRVAKVISKSSSQFNKIRLRNSSGNALIEKIVDSSCTISRVPIFSTPDSESA